MKKTAKERVENYFQMPFEDIIKELHIKEKKSLEELSRQSGIARQTITNIAKRLGLRIRTIQEANKLTKNKGNKHWAYGKTKDNSDWAKSNSDRMKKSNPISNEDTQIKRAITMSKALKNRRLPQEIQAANIFTSFGIEFIEQYPVGPYNLDFYIKELNLAIEIDSTDKWGGGKKDKAIIRDEFLLNEFKIKTIRINKNWLSNRETILNILKANDIIN